MKKIIAILLVLVTIFACSSVAFADGKTKSPIYDSCLSKVGTSADGYTGVYLYKVVTPPLPYLRGGKASTLIKFGTITAPVGFVRHVFRDVGVDVQARTVGELKAAVTRISKAQDGAILFYSKTERIKGGVVVRERIGIYADGYQFYINGGFVVMEPYRSKDWSSIGRLCRAKPPMISKDKYDFILSR